MLLQKYRLKKSGDIKGILKSVRSFREGFLILKIKNNDLNFSRFAFLISLKISKKATIRNRLKRKLREIIRLNLGRIKSGVDVILIVISDFSAKNNKEIEELVNKLFIKSSIFKRNICKIKYI